LLLLLALLQVTLMPHLTVAHVRPDLVLAAVVCWALVRGATEGAIWGFLGGLALDLLSAAPFGIHTVVMTLVGTLAGFGAALIPSEHALLLPAVSVLCTIFQQGACLWLLRAAGWPLEWGPALVTVVLPAALLNLLLTVLLYPLAGLLNRQPALEESGW
jgi:rod shape-determining protein MreD